MLYEEIPMFGFQLTMFYPFNALPDTVLIQAQYEDFAFYHASKQPSA
jgi:hypothetical protein